MSAEIIKWLKELKSVLSQLQVVVYAHGERHEPNGGDPIAGVTPAAHEETHRDGGSDPISGALKLEAIPNLPASRITSGVFDLARIPTMDDAHIPDLETLSYGGAFTEAQIPSLGLDKIKDTELQRGSGVTDASGDATITFPTAFAATPLVFLQGVDAGAKGIVLDVVSKSTTGFVVKARKVTGITSGSAGAHTHSFTPAGSISSDSAGTPSGSISSKSAGTPSGTIGSAGSHRHSYTPSGTIGSPSTTQGASLITSYDPATYAYDSSGDCGGACTRIFLGITEFSAVIAAGRDHVHTFTGSSAYTGYAGSHSHSFTGNALPTHSHTFTGSALPTHSHTFTGSAGTTGSAGSHSHSVDAPVLAIDFAWLAVKA